MDATQPRPPRDDSDRDEKVVANPTAGDLRCPYCHDTLTGGLAGDCVRCGTRHHLSCFADHHGCSTHGCGSTRLSTATRDGSDLRFSPLSCAVCRDPLPREAMVARCRGCDEVLHVECYERLKSCARGPAGCAGPLEVMPHVEVAAAQLAKAGSALLGVGVAWLVPALALTAVAATKGGEGPLIALALVTLLAVLMCGAGLVLRRRGRRLLDVEPRARTGPPKT